MAPYLHSCLFRNSNEYSHGISLHIHLPKSYKGEGQLYETHMYFDDWLQSRFNNCSMLLCGTYSESVMVFRSISL
jgi:hypothetical protein